MQYKEDDELEGIITISCRCLRKKHGWLNTVEIDKEGDKQLCDIVLNELRSKYSHCSLFWLRGELEEALYDQFPEYDDDDEKGYSE